MMGFNTNSPFDDKYFVRQDYLSKIEEVGALPIMISPVDFIINTEILDLCDAFLIPGGNILKQYHFDIINYALNTNKKLLGICMGMQAIAMYANKDINEKTLKLVDNHYYDEKITHENKEVLVHEVNFIKGSLLHTLYNKEKMKVNSVHNYCVKNVSFPFNISAFCDDIVEGVEYKNILGVQFHPELMEDGNVLFKWLVE